MKTILCYGDSNTWGADPAGLRRFSRTERWPGVLQSALGDDYEVIAEGLPGRTTVFDDPLEEFRSGKTYLLPCLYSHRPIDLVILLLGTNDLKKRLGMGPMDIAVGAGLLVGMIQKSDCGPDGKAPKVLLLAPPPVLELPNSRLNWMFGGAAEKSQQFGTCYRQIAEQYQCGFFDTASVIQSSPLDGIHFEVEAHSALGGALLEQVSRLLR